MKALVIVDIQKGLMDKNIYNKGVFIATINQAIKTFTKNREVVVFIQHNNKKLVENTSDWKIDNSIEYSTFFKTIQKEHGNAFEQTELNDYLRNKNIQEIVVCGLVTHGCVKATCLGGLENNYIVSILHNGHSCWSNDTKEKIKKVEEELKSLGINSIEL